MKTISNMEMNKMNGSVELFHIDKNFQAHGKPTKFLIWDLPSGYFISRKKEFAGSVSLTVFPKPIYYKAKNHVCSIHKSMKFFLFH